MSGRMDLEKLYLHMPIWLQKIMIYGEGWRRARRYFGGGFKEIFAAALEREQWDADRMRAYQEQRLSAFLKVADTSPFWHARFAKYSVDVESSDPFGERQKLPILAKQEVQENLSEVLTQSPDLGETIRVNTSGTTGAGLIFYKTARATKEQASTWWRYRNWHGINFKTRNAYFRGWAIVPRDTQQPPFWRWDAHRSRLMCSINHLSPKSVPDYVEAFREHKVEWLHGYPSAIVYIANEMLEQGIKPVESLRIITTGAESLYPQQRRILTKAFKAPVREHYGLAEDVANLSECEEGRLHVDEDFAGVEFVPVKGQEGTYHVIGTNWSNHAFPLIRYDTSDIAILAEGKCSCGRPGRVIETVDGRKEDYVALPDGRTIGCLFSFLFKNLIHVREAQVYQPDRSRLVLRVVKGAGYDETDEESQMLLETRKRVGDEIQIDIEYVKELERTPAGKVRYVVSEVPMKWALD